MGGVPEVLVAIYTGDFGVEPGSTFLGDFVHRMLSVEFGRVPFFFNQVF